MNNRGYAITTIIFGTMILFCLLLVSLLNILSTYKNNLEKLIDSSLGTRDTVTLKAQTYDNFEALKNTTNPQRGLYCFKDETKCRYVSNSELK